MTVPVQEPEQTLGYLLCHHRRYGCGWLTTYRTMDAQRDAQRLRATHESVCAFRPYPDLYA